MKISIRHLRTASGHPLVLCDENGRALPMQTKVTLVSEPGDFPKAIVEFNVDGDILSINHDTAVE